MTHIDYIAFLIVYNWSIKRIASAFDVSREFAKLYIQPCFKPDAVAEIMVCRKACIENNWE